MMEGRIAERFVRGPEPPTSMTAIATILVPFFSLILLGYGAGRLKLVPAAALAGLDFFVLYLAMPALFFQLIATTPVASLAGWSYVVATTFATYCAFAVAFSFAALLNGGRVPEATIEGLIGSYGNVGILGPALAVSAFGAAAAAPTALIFSFDTIVLLIVTPLMMALGGTARTNARLLAADIGWRMFLHPFIIAAALGFLAAAIGFQAPAGIDTLLTMLRQAAVPTALFAFGVAQSLRAFGRTTVELPILVAVKLIVHPTIVYLLLSWVGGYDGIWVKVAVLLAALPPAAEILTLARHYGVAVERVSTAILIGAALSIATVTITLILLVSGTLSLDPFH